MPYALVEHDSSEFAAKINELKTNPRLVEALAVTSLNVARKNTWRKSADILMKQVQMSLSNPQSKT